MASFGTLGLLRWIRGEALGSEDVSVAALDEVPGSTDFFDGGDAAVNGAGRLTGSSSSVIISNGGIDDAILIASSWTFGGATVDTTCWGEA